MTRRLHHPLWTHAPALALYVWMLAALWRAMPLRARVPVHFDWSGQPDRWGSPWELAAVVIVVPLVLIALGVFAEESWARTEASKRFNFITPFPQAVLGFVAGGFVAHLELLRRGEEMRITVPWATMLALAAGAGVLAAVLELLRPPRPAEQLVAIEDTSRLEAEIAARMKAGERWAYWETQNPVYFSILAFAASVSLLVGAWYVWKPLPWLAPVYLVAAAALLLCCGGLRVSITSERVEVRLGMLGLRLLCLPIAELAASEVQTFSPLGDFGGWGIRRGRKMWGFFFRGNRGVKLRTNAGKQYLIGSDHPERLAAVIAAARQLPRPARDSQ